MTYTITVHWRKGKKEVFYTGHYPTLGMAAVMIVDDTGQERHIPWTAVRQITVDAREA